MARQRGHEKTIRQVEGLLEVFEIIRDRASGISPEELAPFLPRPLSTEAIETAVRELQRIGLVVRSPRGFREARGTHLRIGRVKAGRTGGLTLIGRDAEVTVRSADSRGAMDRDIVLARLDERKGPRGRPTAVVTAVLRRAHTQIFGRFEFAGAVAMVVPSDRRVRCTVEIPKGERGGAKDGDIVVCDIVEYPTEAGRMPVGRVSEVLGDEWDPRIEIEVIIRQHGLSEHFPDEVEAEARLIPEDPAPADMEGRRDYRSELVFTIDGEDAKDFDDAVSIRPHKSGGWRLTVHIADVAHYVRPGRPLWEEARERGTSCYLADRVIPMLPERISNGSCSLRPKVDRLVMSTEMDITADGSVHMKWVGPGVIHSAARLTYEGVDEFFTSGNVESLAGAADGAMPDGIGDALEDLRALSDVLEDRRTARGSIGFETIETKVIVDELGRAAAIETRERTPATKVIEEAMIATNETIASHMQKASPGMVYRIHETPDSDLIEQVVKMLEVLGFDGAKWDTSEGVDPRLIQAVIHFAHTRPERLLVNSLLLRSMKQARYSTLKVGHFGLGSKSYTHFTSPIRRFPDLIVHAMLRGLMSGRLGAGAHEDPAASKRDTLLSVIPQLPALCEDASIREREAESAERESVEVKVCEYMQRHLGETFDAVVSGVAAWGFWAELENSAEGLVHISQLTDDRYIHEPELFRLRGMRTGRIFRIGQKVRVTLNKVNVGARQMDFSLSE